MLTSIIALLTTFFIFYKRARMIIFVFKMLKKAYNFMRERSETPRRRRAKEE